MSASVEAPVLASALLGQSSSSLGSELFNANLGRAGSEKSSVLGPLFGIAMRSASKSRSAVQTSPSPFRSSIFVAGRSLTHTVAEFSRPLDSASRGLSAVAAGKTALTKLSDLLKQAEGLSEAARASELRRDNVAVDVTGAKSLESDQAARVVSSKVVEGQLNFLNTGLVKLGQTLTVKVGSTTHRITFGPLGGQVSNSTQLRDQLNAISGLKASFDSGGHLVIESTPEEGADAVAGFKIGGTADIDALLGIPETQFTGVSLLTQGLSQGETLTFSVAGAAEQVITFGNGEGEVSSLAELKDALALVSGLSALVDGSNRLTFAATDRNVTVAVAGTADTEAVFGIERRLYEPTVVETIFEPQTAGGDLAESLGDIRQQIDDIIANADAGGINLLLNGAFDVRFGGLSGAGHARQGAQLSAAALGLDVLSPAAHASLNDVDAAIAAALDRIDTEAARLAANEAILGLRTDFSNARVGDLEMLDNAPTDARAQTLLEADEAKRLAAETRSLFARGLLSPTRGLIPDDRDILVELFDAALGL